MMNADRMITMIMITLIMITTILITTIMIPMVMITITRVTKTTTMLEESDSTTVTDIRGEAGMALTETQHGYA